MLGKTSTWVVLEDHPYKTGNPNIYHILLKTLRARRCSKCGAPWRVRDPQHLVLLVKPVQWKCSVCPGSVAER